MPFKSIFSNYALIGEDLELKQNVSIEVNENGIISNISYENLENVIINSSNSHCFLLLPCFINSHTHVGDNFAKELGFNKELTEVVAPPFGLKHQLLRQTEIDIKIEGIKKAALEMLSNGISCFIDFREGGIEGIKLIKNALETIPINCLIFGRFMDESEIESVFNLADGIGLSSYKFITNSTKKFISNSKKSHNKMIACHCAEKNRSSELINRLFADNLVDIIIHGTKYIREDLMNIQKLSKSLVICPRCNGYFGVGFPPITEVLKLEIPISLGTDNSMANSLDMFEEMRYLYRIFRVLSRHEKSIHLTSKELLKMVTINAARNFRLENERGSISMGKKADFFVIDLNEPNLYTSILNESNIFDLIVQRTVSANIKRTYIKGEVAFERK
ncbi:MAG: amidohydrolase family protein [Candidatus Thorarchaeota archaeon]